MEMHSNRATANSGTPPIIDAVCSVSNPPTNISTIGMNDNANAQNKRFQRNGSSSTSFCTTAARMYEIESKVVAVNISANKVNTKITR